MLFYFLLAPRLTCRQVRIHMPISSTPVVRRKVSFQPPLSLVLHSHMCADHGNGSAVVRHIPSHPYPPIPRIHHPCSPLLILLPFSVMISVFITATVEYGGHVDTSGSEYSRAGPTVGVVSKTGTDIDAKNLIRMPWPPPHSSPVNVRSTHGSNDGSMATALVVVERQRQGRQQGGTMVMVVVLSL